MLKKVILSIVAAVVVAIAVLNVNMSKKREHFSDLMLANIAALAQPEDGGSWCYIVCYCAGNVGGWLTETYYGPCSGGPWDRNANCPNGYQDCDVVVFR